MNLIIISIGGNTIKQITNIYDILNEVIKPDATSLSPNSFYNDLFSKLSEEQDQKIYKVLTNIASLSIKFEDPEAKFKSRIKIPGEWKIFNIQDLTDDDYIMLKKLNLNKLPLLLQARIGDLLWTEKK